MTDLNRIKQLAGLAINELDDTDSGDWSFTTTAGHKVVDQIDPADGDKHDQYHVSTPVGDITAYYDASYDEDGGDFVEFDAENSEVKRLLPQSAKHDELNDIINNIVDTVAGGKNPLDNINSVIPTNDTTDKTKSYKTPYGKVDANWDSNAGEFGDFDAEDKQLRDIMMNMADNFGSVDHDNVREFVRAALKKRRSMG